MKTSNQIAVHTDRFSGASFIVARNVPSLSTVDAANDSQDPMFQAPTVRGLSDMLASFDIVTPDNVRAYMALVSA